MLSMPTIIQPPTGRPCACRALVAFVVAGVALIATANSAADPAVCCAPMALRDGDLVAPPLALARLRALLEECVVPPPTGDEFAILVAIHRDMVSSYGAAREGSAGDAWRAGNSLFDELRDLKRDPSRARLEQVVRAQERMLADADAAERSMFEAVAAVLSADETEESRRSAVRAGVERARAVREADRLLASIPLEEPSGACAGLRGAVQRLHVTAEVRDRLDGILAERDASLASSLRRVLRAYQSFVVAAADAFDEVFGGALPPIGAVFSEREAESVRARMRALCEREGLEFLAARAELRAREDATVERLCNALSVDDVVELRLRLSPSASHGYAGFLVATEGHVRDALRELPAGEPAHAAVSEFAARWREALLRELRRETEALRTREDSSFWNPSPWRGGLLDLEAELGQPFDRRWELELDRIVAPIVMAAGGRLGNLQAEASESGAPRLLERRTVGAWRAELAHGETERMTQPGLIGVVDVVFLSDDSFAPGGAIADARMRRGIPRPLARQPMDGDCADTAWTEYQRRWSVEVESAIGPFAEARRALQGFVATQDLDSTAFEGALVDASDRLNALTRALTLRDSAWRRAEAADEAYFVALAECCGDDSAEACREVSLARFRRFLERERDAAPADALGTGAIDEQPDWVSVVRDAGLAPSARARVERRLVEFAPRYAMQTITRRQVAFSTAAAIDAARLGLADSAFHRQRMPSPADRKAAAERASLATADLVAAILDAAMDGSDGPEQLARLEAAVVTALSRGWSPDPVVERTARLAVRAAKDATERSAVERAIGAFRTAHRAAHERAARLALAGSPLARTSDGRTLFPVPVDAASAGSAERRAAELAREQADLRAALEIDLQAILGRDRWAHVVPPDSFHLRGVGDRADPSAPSAEAP
jgi:hypothetical protein